MVVISKRWGITSPKRGWIIIITSCTSRLIINTLEKLSMGRFILRIIVLIRSGILRLEWWKTVSLVMAETLIWGPLNRMTVVAGLCHNLLSHRYCQRRQNSIRLPETSSMSKSFKTWPQKLFWNSPNVRRTCNWKRSTSLLLHLVLAARCRRQRQKQNYSTHRCSRRLPSNQLNTSIRSLPPQSERTICTRSMSKPWKRTSTTHCKMKTNSRKSSSSSQARHNTPPL